MDKTPRGDARSILRQQFLHATGWRDCVQFPLPGDASFRRYIRLSKNGTPAMLMDAPPPTENVRPFVQIAHHLLGLGFSAPKILAQDQKLGFLIIEDFGDDTFTQLLSHGANENELYTLATDTLAQLHQHPAPDWLKPYDNNSLLKEIDLLPIWFMGAQGLELSDHDMERYHALWCDLFTHIHRGPKTLVLRDYHVDNLMQLSGRPDTVACGLLDFQDALLGHPAYDLMSLLEDARRDISNVIQITMKDRYHAALNTKDREAFDLAYAILGACRHAKVIGIFTRLDRRDHKPHYLKHIDRLWRLLEHSLSHPILSPMKDWIDTHVPAHKRTAPLAQSVKQNEEKL